METKTLEYILEIARCRSVTKAAQAVDGAETADKPAPAAGDSYDEWD